MARKSYWNHFQLLLCFQETHQELPINIITVLVVRVLLCTRYFSFQSDNKKIKSHMEREVSASECHASVKEIKIKKAPGLLPLPPPLCLLSLCPFTTITATGRPWQLKNTDTISELLISVLRCVEILPIPQRETAGAQRSTAWRPFLWVDDLW